MMSLADQLAVIQADYTAAWTSIWCWCAAVLTAVLAVIYLVRTISRYVDAMGRSGRIAQIAGIAVTVALMVYGVEKPIYEFHFLYGLEDNRSYATNDTAVARWSVSNPVLLDGYVVQAQYKNMTITNGNGQCTDEWHKLEGCPVSDLEKSWIIPDATNCYYIVWAEYVAPVVVHTNGVYHLGGVDREMGGSQKYVPYAIKIKVNMEDGMEVLTPTNAPPAVTGLQRLYNETEDNEQ